MDECRKTVPLSRKNSLDQTTVALHFSPVPHEGRAVRGRLHLLREARRRVKGGVLRDVLEGRLPERFRLAMQLPFNFQKGEQLVWAFPDVKYHEVRSRRSYVGGYEGVSVRIARGVYYRLGGFRGNPVDTAEAAHVDTGILGVTQKHLYFAGPTKSFRVRALKCKARIRAGWDRGGDDRGYYGVSLKLSLLARVMAMNRAQRAVVAVTDLALAVLSGCLLGVDMALG